MSHEQKWQTALIRQIVDWAFNPDDPAETLEQNGYKTRELVRALGKDQQRWQDFTAALSLVVRHETRGYHAVLLGETDHDAAIRYCLGFPIGQPIVAIEQNIMPDPNSRAAYEHHYERRLYLYTRDDELRLHVGVSLTAITAVEELMRRCDERVATTMGVLFPALQSLVPNIAMRLQTSATRENELNKFHSTYLLDLLRKLTKSQPQEEGWHELAAQLLVSLLSVASTPTQLKLLLRNIAEAL